MKIKVCSRCGMHETSALINFDKFGICKGCISSEQKMHINWFERQKKLKKIFKYYQKIQKIITIALFQFLEEKIAPINYIY